jgi:hypothetical protein
MVPASFRLVDLMPVGATGKLDRRQVRELCSEPETATA